MMVDVQLRWCASAPAALPENADSDICVIGLCVPESPLEHLEARLQRRHLQPQDSVNAWNSQRLARLATAMTNTASRRDGSESDAVLLRRGAGHMVIDVLFRGEAAGKAVELLIAYPTGTSACSSAVHLLRSVAFSQHAHRQRIAKAQSQLEAGRVAKADIEERWSAARTGALGRRHDLLWRFALLLRAKIDKEWGLRAELEARGRAKANAAMVSVPAPMLLQPGIGGSGIGVSPNLCMPSSEVDVQEDRPGRRACGRGRGRRGGRGRGQILDEEEHGRARAAKRPRRAAPKAAARAMAMSSCSSSGGEWMPAAPTAASAPSGGSAVVATGPAVQGVLVGTQPSAIHQTAGSLFDPMSSDEDPDAPGMAATRQCATGSLANLATSTAPVAAAGSTAPASVGVSQEQPPVDVKRRLAGVAPSGAALHRSLFSSDDEDA